MLQRKMRLKPTKSYKRHILLTLAVCSTIAIMFYILPSSFTSGEKSLPEKEEHVLEKTEGQPIPQKKEGLQKKKKIKEDQILRILDNVLEKTESQPIPQKKERFQKKKKIKVRLTQIEILNGTGVPNLAKKITPFFRNKNLDVITIGNYKINTQKKSFFIVYAEDVKEKARKLAKYIGTQRVDYKITQKLTHELTFVIGLDYAKLNFR